MDKIQIDQSYTEQGFYLWKNVLSNNIFQELEAILLKLINRYLKVKNLTSQEWIDLAINNPQIVTEIYDALRDNECLLTIGKQKVITDKVKTLIKDPLLYKKIPFRIDVPFNTKEFAFWHQDDFYVEGNEQELTAWIPLFDTQIQQGCLAIMPGSHKLKKVPHTLQIGKKFIPQNIYDREIRFIEMKRGDMLFFSSFLLHSSNLNFSSDIRYSIQLRYTTNQLSPSNNMKGTIHV